MEKATMRICADCKTELSENQHFCHNCGAEYVEPVSVSERICEGCSTVLAENQKFCHVCGREYVLPLKKCPKCGAQINKSGNFCPECGAALNTASAPKKKSKVTKSFILDVVKRSMAFAVSILMVVFAFMPIVNLTIDSELLDLKEDLDIKISPLDGIIFFVDSLYNLDAEDIQDSKLYDEVEDLNRKYIEDWTDGDETDKLALCIRKFVRLGLRAEGYKLNPTQVMCAILAFIYIGVAVASFILSLIWLLSLFFKCKSMKNPAVMLIGAMLPLTVVLLAAFDIAYPNKFSYSSSYAQSSITAFAVLTMVFSFILLAFFAISRLCVENKPRVNVLEIVKRVLSIGFATTLLFLAFAPFFTTTARIEFVDNDRAVKAETTLGASIFSEMTLTEDEKDAIDDMKNSEIDDSIISIFEELFYYTEREFEKGKAPENNELINALALYYGGYETSGLFIFGGFMVVLVSFLAAVIIWLNLCAVALGVSPNFAASISAKVLAIIAAIYTLVLTIVIAKLTTSNADVVKISYDVTVSAGSILMMIFAVLTAAVPIGISAKKIKSDNNTSVIEN